MRVSLQLGALALSALPLAEAITLDCKSILIEKVEYDINPLAGVHSVEQILDEGPTNRNITFTFDLCKALADKNVPRPEQCPHGTRVCATERFYDKEKQEKEPPIAEQWAVAGEYTTSSGKPLDPKYERISSSGSNQDQEAELDGVRIYLHGGERKEDERSTLPQMAIFELICDRSAQETVLQSRRDEDGDKEDGDGGKNDDGDEKKSDPDANAEKALSFRGYKVETQNGKATQVLRVSWKTIHACEGEAGKHKGSASSSSWGFFGWFIIILFLAIAAYLIFGSWINYSRHGARGLDLLPHSDTIRDVPYILKDIGRRLVSTVQGGNRGGYNQI